MPRGRKSTVRYYFDHIADTVVAVSKEGIRVLSEYLPGGGSTGRKTGARRGRPPGSGRKKAARAPAPGKGTQVTLKKRGEKRKRKSGGSEIGKG